MQSAAPLSGALAAGLRQQSGQILLSGGRKSSAALRHLRLTAVEAMATVPAVPTTSREVVSPGDARPVPLRSRPLHMYNAQREDSVALLTELGSSYWQQSPGHQS